MSQVSNQFLIVLVGAAQQCIRSRQFLPIQQPSGTIIELVDPILQENPEEQERFLTHYLQNELPGRHPDNRFYRLTLDAYLDQRNMSGFKRIIFVSYTIECERDRGSQKIETMNNAILLNLGHYWTNIDLELLNSWFRLPVTKWKQLKTLTHQISQAKYAGNLLLDATEPDNDGTFNNETYANVVYETKDFSNQVAEYPEQRQLLELILDTTVNSILSYISTRIDELIKLMDRLDKNKGIKLSDLRLLSNGNIGLKLVVQVVDEVMLRNLNQYKKLLRICISQKSMFKIIETVQFGSDKIHIFSFGS